MKSQLHTLSLIIYLIPAVAFSQEKITTNTNYSTSGNGWYIEVGGSSILGLTVNYERYLSKKPGGLSVHAGFGGAFFFSSGGSGGFGVIPAGLSYNIPISKNHRNFIEVGGTYTYLFGSESGENILSLITSWRFVAAPKGLQLRATLIPFLFLQSESSAFGPWLGFSIGKRF
jgi:hypothetical protein